MAVVGWQIVKWYYDATMTVKQRRRLEGEYPKMRRRIAQKIHKISRVDLHEYVDEYMKDTLEVCASKWVEVERHSVILYNINLANFITFIYSSA